MTLLPEDIWPLSASLLHVSAFVEHSIVLGQIVWPCHGRCGAASRQGIGFGWAGILWITVQPEQFR